MSKDDYFLIYYNEEKKNKKLSLPNKCGYTITEAIKIFQLACDSKDRGKSATFWKEIEDKGLIPERRAESMRNFLKTSLKYGLEPYFK